MVFVSDLFNPSTVLAILITLSLRYEWKEFFQAKKWKTETKAMTILKIPKLEREFEQCTPLRQCVILCNSTFFSSSKQAATFFNVRSNTALKISYESQGYIYEWIVAA